MRRYLAITGVFGLWLCSVSSVLAATGDDLARAVGMLFAGGPGDAGGDVNADGLATAADLPDAVNGHRSPTQPGPYGVGVKRITFAKPSETQPEVTRTLRTTIWYPSEPGTGPTNTRPGGTPDAPLAAGLSSLPLVVFSHGSCGFQEQSIYLTSWLASYGFVVAAPPHPGNSTAEILTCRSAPAVADSFANRPADIRYVIDQMLALNTAPDGFFSGAIDPARIGVSGHSFGGLTTLRVSAADARVVAGLALAPVTRSIQSEIAAIDIPIMIQVGELDGLLADARLAYGLLGPPKYLLEIARMTHSPFSDLCTECTPQTLAPAQAHLYALRYAVPFLLHWVAGDSRFDAFLNPAAVPAGATYQTDVAAS
jgi:predicted dienelactone hydrolase